MHSYGKTRLRKKGKILSSRKKVEEKPKHVEQKKVAKPEPALEKLTVVETKVEEIVIKVPETTEIKEEIKPTETQEKDITELPAIASEPVKVEPEPQERNEEEIKKEMQKETEKSIEEIKKEVLKQEPKKEEIRVEEQKKEEPKKEKATKEKVKKEEKAKEKPEKAAPKKRGRPKKKEE